MWVCVVRVQSRQNREKRRIAFDQKSSRERQKRERMLSRTAIRFFSVQKRTTGLVGVQVLENPRESLIDIYQKTLDTIKVRWFYNFSSSKYLKTDDASNTKKKQDSGIPTSAQYYKDVEALTTYRKNIVEKETDVRRFFLIFVLARVSKPKTRKLENTKTHTGKQN